MPITKRLIKVAAPKRKLEQQHTHSGPVPFDDALTIDCTGMDLAKLVKAALENDADEIVFRVCSFDAGLNPTEFQTIVRFNDRTRIWATNVSKDAMQSLLGAVYKASKQDGPTLRKRIYGNAEDNTRLPAKPAVGGISRTAGKAGIKSRPTLSKPKRG